MVTHDKFNAISQGGVTYAGVQYPESAPEPQDVMYFELQKAVEKECFVNVVHVARDVSKHEACLDKMLDAKYNPTRDAIKAVRNEFGEVDVMLSHKSNKPLPVHGKKASRFKQIVANGGDFAVPLNWEKYDYFGPDYRLRVLKTINYSQFDCKIMKRCFPGLSLDEGLVQFKRFYLELYTKQWFKILDKNSIMLVEVLKFMAHDQYMALPVFQPRKEYAGEVFNARFVVSQKQRTNNTYFTLQNLPYLMKRFCNVEPVKGKKNFLSVLIHAFMQTPAGISDCKLTGLRRDFKRRKVKVTHEPQMMQTWDNIFTGLISGSASKLAQSPEIKDAAANIALDALSSLPSNLVKLISSKLAEGAKSAISAIVSFVRMVYDQVVSLFSSIIDTKDPELNEIVVKALSIITLLFVLYKFKNVIGIYLNTIYMGFCALLSELIPGCRFNIHQYWSQCFGCHESQTLGVSTVLSSIFGIVFAVFCGRELPAASQVINIASRGGTLVESLIETSAEFLDYLVFNMFGKHILESKVELEFLNDYMTELKDIADIPDLETQAMQSDRIATRVASVVAKGRRIMPVLDRVKGFNHSLHHRARGLHTYLTDIHLKTVKLSSMYRNRPETIGFWMEGGSGVGKTLLIDLFSTDILHLMRRMFGEEEIPLDGADTVFNICAGSDYFDCYRGQPIVTKDECFASKIKSERYKEAASILTMIGSGVMPLNMAAVDFKGTELFRSLMVIFTSNLHMHEFDQCDLTEPGALVRRMNFPIRVHQLQNPDGSRVEMKPDHSNLDDCWLFEVITVPDSANEQKICLSEYLYQYRHSNGQWYLTYTQLLTAMFLEMKNRKLKPKKKLVQVEINKPKDSSINQLYDELVKSGMETPKFVKDLKVLPLPAQPTQTLQRGLTERYKDYKRRVKIDRKNTEEAIVESVVDSSKNGLIPGEFVGRPGEFVSPPLAPPVQGVVSGKELVDSALDPDLVLAKALSVSLTVVPELPKFGVPLSFSVSQFSEMNVALDMTIEEDPVITHDELRESIVDPDLVMALAISESEIVPVVSSNGEPLEGLRVVVEDLPVKVSSSSSSCSEVVIIMEPSAEKVETFVSSSTDGSSDTSLDGAIAAILEFEMSQDTSNDEALARALQQPTQSCSISESSSSEEDRKFEEAKRIMDDPTSARNPDLVAFFMDELQKRDKEAWEKFERERREHEEMLEEKREEEEFDRHVVRNQNPRGKRFKDPNSPGSGRGFNKGGRGKRHKCHTHVPNMFSPDRKDLVRKMFIESTREATQVAFPPSPDYSQYASLSLPHDWREQLMNLRNEPIEDCVPDRVHEPQMFSALIAGVKAAYSDAKEAVNDDPLRDLVQAVQESKQYKQVRHNLGESSAHISVPELATFDADKGTRVRIPTALVFDDFSPQCFPKGSDGEYKMNHLAYLDFCHSAAFFDTCGQRLQALKDWNPKFLSQSRFTRQFYNDLSSSNPKHHKLPYKLISVLSRCKSLCVADNHERLLYARKIARDEICKMVDDEVTRINYFEILDLFIRHIYKFDVKGDMNASADDFNLFIQDSHDSVLLSLWMDAFCNVIKDESKLRIEDIIREVYPDISLEDYFFLLPKTRKTTGTTGCLFDYIIYRLSNQHITVSTYWEGRKVRERAVSNWAQYQEAKTKMSVSYDQFRCEMEEDATKFQVHVTTFAEDVKNFYNEKIPTAVKWAGCVTVVAAACVGLGFLIKALVDRCGEDKVVEPKPVEAMLQSDSRDSGMSMNKQYSSGSFAPQNAAECAGRINNVANNIEAIAIEYGSTTKYAYGFFSGTTFVTVSHVFNLFGRNFSRIIIMNIADGKERKIITPDQVKMRFPEDGRDVVFLDFLEGVVQARVGMRNHMRSRGNKPQPNRPCARVAVMRDQNWKKNQTLIYEKASITIEGLSKSTGVVRNPDNGAICNTEITDYYLLPGGGGAAGDCGFVYMCTSNDESEYIYGIHVGCDGVNSLFCPIYKEDFNVVFNSHTSDYGERGPDVFAPEAYLPPYWDMITKPSINYEGDLPQRSRLVGQVKKKVFMPMNPSHTATVFQCGNLGPIFPVETTPAKLNAQTKKVAVDKLGAVDPVPIPMELWRFIFNDHSRLTSRFRPDLMERRPHRLELGVSIKGRAGDIEPADGSTCEGYLLNFLGLKKADLYKVSKDYPGSYDIPVHHLLKQQCGYLSTAARAGMIPMMLTCGFLKGELRPNEKAESVRFFHAGCPIHMLWVKQVLGDAIAMLKKNRHRTSCAIGSNAHGMDWAYIYAKFKQIFKDVGAGDFSKYDTSVPHYAAYIMGLFFNSIYGYVPHSEDWNEVMGACMSCAGYYCIFGDLVLWYENGNPSGGYCTGVLNSIWNIVMNAFIFHVAQSDCCDECGLTKMTFEQACDLEVYGDDNIYAYLRSVSHHFTMMKMEKYYFDIFGATYSNPDKSAITVPFIELDEVVFLSRRFELRDGIVYAPLKKESINGMLLWTRDPAQEFLELNIERASMEMYHYGYEEWIAWAARVQDYCRHYNVNWTGKSFSHWREMHFSSLKG